MSEVGLRLGWWGGGGFEMCGRLCVCVCVRLSSKLPALPLCCYPLTLSSPYLMMTIEKVTSFRTRNGQGLPARLSAFMEAAFAPERGDQFLPPPVTEGGSTFLDALIRSATHSEAQVFTEATPPFKICHANNAWSLLCGYSVPEVLGKTCKILQGPETDPDRLRDLHARCPGIAADSKFEQDTTVCPTGQLTTTRRTPRGSLVTCGQFKDKALSRFVFKKTRIRTRKKNVTSYVYIPTRPCHPAVYGRKWLTSEHLASRDDPLPAAAGVAQAAEVVPVRVRVVVAAVAHVVVRTAAAAPQPPRAATP